MLNLFKTFLNRIEHFKNWADFNVSTILWIFRNVSPASPPSAMGGMFENKRISRLELFLSSSDFYNFWRFRGEAIKREQTLQVDSKHRRN